MPQNARSFWKVLLSRQLRVGVLRRVSFTTFGLGDSSYPQYNVAHRMLHSRMLQLGAQLFCQRGEGNEQHPEGHTGEFRAWIVDLKESLLEHFPVPAGREIIGEDVFIQPKWFLKPADGSVATTQLWKDCSKDAGGSLPADRPPGDDLLPIKDAVTATLSANTRLTPTAHHQDVRLLDFAMQEHIPYNPGAVAVVYPKNFPQDVNAFIDSQSWQEVADAPIQILPTAEGVDLKRYPPSPLRNVEGNKKTFTLRELLTNYLDILSIPRRSFFASLAHFAKDGNEDEQYQKERILELANPELIDELWDYTTRPRRTILEIMPDFTSIKIPWQYALTILPIMRGRQFSIASGGELKFDATGGTKVQLLVAIANPPNPIIKYRKRHGVCTRYIAQLKAGSQLKITIQPGYLNVKKEEIAVPVLMIGPGTGVAPMRSMIYERRAWAKELALDADAKDGGDCSGSVLFYGCRNEQADYFFHEEWDNLSRQGLTVFAGFSRDKDKPKTYVQDLIRAQAHVVRDMLINRQGKIYVCGSSGNMPKGVRDAFVEVIREDASMKNQSNDYVEGFVDQLEKEGRYKQETW